MRSSRIQTFATLLFVWLATVGGCTINFGGGGNQGCGTYCGSLSVPYRAQDNQYYCGPAVILMWRLYDGLPEVTQAEIANGIGCTIGQGASKSAITNGVNLFTTSGANAVLDYGPNSGTLDYLQGVYFSAEIASIGGGTPFIAYINSGLHSVIVTGGRWDYENGHYRWNTVRYHDPLEGANQEAVAADWIEDTYGQAHTIVSSYVAGAVAGYEEYENVVTYWGGSGGGGGWPPEI